MLKRVLKWTGLGCGGFLGLILLAGLLGAVIESIGGSGKDTDVESPSSDIALPVVSIPLATKADISPEEITIAVTEVEQRVDFLELDRLPELLTEVERELGINVGWVISDEDQIATCDLLSALGEEWSQSGGSIESTGQLLARADPKIVALVGLLSLGNLDVENYCLTYVVGYEIGFQTGLKGGLDLYDASLPDSEIAKYVKDALQKVDISTIEGDADAGYSAGFFDGMDLAGEVYQNQEAAKVGKTPVPTVTRPTLRPTDSSVLTIEIRDSFQEVQIEEFKRDPCFIGRGQFGYIWNTDCQVSRPKGSYQAKGLQFNRDDWGGWIDADGDCQDTRQEVLIEESLTPVTFEDERKCRVASGEWRGPYTGEIFTDPSKLAIDHLVPLANSYYSGGVRWDYDRRETYFNDLSHESHLLAVSASAHRSKWSDSPADWKPPLQQSWCDYARSWIEVKAKWQLTFKDDEANALEGMLSTCDPAVRLERR